LSRTIGIDDLVEVETYLSELVEDFKLQRRLNLSFGLVLGNTLKRCGRLVLSHDPPTKMTEVYDKLEEVLFEIHCFKYYLSKPIDKRGTILAEKLTSFLIALNIELGIRRDDCPLGRYLTPA
jgi:hypothetical protein